MFTRHQSISSTENTNVLNSSKEATIINNNLGNFHRAFGRELSNIQHTDGNRDTRYLRPKSFTVLNQRHGSVNMGKVADNSFLMPKEEPMVIEVCKTSRDPLLLPNQNYFADIFGKKKEEMNIISKDWRVVEDLDAWDKEDLENPQMTAIYNKEIFTYLKSVEEKYIAKPGYMGKTQTDINEKMRAILVDWLVDVHLKFKLLPETLFLTINIIDRYLEKTQVVRQKLQLVGVAALLISCKYEEIYSPEVKDFVIVTDQAYKREEILDMESKILITLNFKITVPTALRFFERFSRIANLDERSSNTSKYCLELCIVEFKMLKYCPSLLAAAAVYLVNKLNGVDIWSEDLVKNSGFDEATVKNCAKEIAVILQNAEKSTLTAVKRKFSSAKYSEVAKLKFSL